jgi:adenine phosphoribosyltransferase
VKAVRLKKGQGCVRRDDFLYSERISQQPREYGKIRRSLPPDSAVSPDQLKALIRDVPDFPKPGILFRDITPLLGDAVAFDAAIGHLADSVQSFGSDGLVAIESRGFLFGAAVAQRLKLPLQIVRKPGKLPSKTASVSYALEYGTDRVEIHVDAIVPGQRYTIIDDVLATGGTAAAASDLVRSLNGHVTGCVFFIELGFLGGRARLQGTPVASVVAY